MIWFTADLHLSHNKILVHCFKTRGRFLTDADKAQAEDLIAKNEVKKFMASKESIENMDSFLIDQINNRAQESDTLWILGDFSFATDNKLRDLFARIKCKDVRMVWGNHDRRNHVYDYCGFTQHWNSVTLFRFKQERDRLYTDSELFLEKSLRKRLEDDYKKTEKIYLSHYCSLVWPIGKSCWSLWGHSHGQLKHPNPNVCGMDVGVDAVGDLGFDALAPVSLDQIDIFMKPRLELFQKPIDS